MAARRRGKIGAMPEPTAPPTQPPRLREPRPAAPRSRTAAPAAVVSRTVVSRSAVSRAVGPLVPGAAVSRAVGPLVPGAADPAAQLAAHRRVLDASAALLPAVLEAARALVEVFAGGGRLYTFGNGGSAADAQHLSGEFVGRYLRDRVPLPAHALTVDASVLTCIANDFDPTVVFARQVRAFVGPGDMVAGFTTSGRSPNVVEGLRAARDQGAVTLLFGGAGADGSGGAAAAYADHLLLVPSLETARIQEMHVLLLHLLSEQVDAWAPA